MAKKLYPESDIQNIADAIRDKNGLSDLYTVGEMAQAIEDIPSGGGDALCTIDFTKINSAYTFGNVLVDSQGAHFDSSYDCLQLPFGRYSGETIVEIDVAMMQLTSGTHRRFIMSGVYSECGFIYKSNGVWALYTHNDAWEEGSFDGATNGSFFDNSTVKVIVDTDYKWHIYKNDVLVWEPVKPQILCPSDYSSKFFIGSTAQAINNALITGVRIY